MVGSDAQAGFTAFSVIDSREISGTPGFFAFSPLAGVVDKPTFGHFSLKTAFVNTTKMSSFLSKTAFLAHFRGICLFEIELCMCILLLYNG